MRKIGFISFWLLLAGCASIEKTSWQYESQHPILTSYFDGGQTKIELARNGWEAVQSQTIDRLDNDLGQIERYCSNHSRIDSPFTYNGEKIGERTCHKWLLAAALMPVSYFPKKTDDQFFADLKKGFQTNGIAALDNIEMADSGAAVAEYYRRGFDVTYFNPSLYGFWREPETFILTRRFDNRAKIGELSADLENDIFIVFSGSETYNDWTANFFGSLKPAIFDGRFFLPAGQWAVRSRVHNLVRKDFILPPADDGALHDTVLTRHLDRYRPGWRSGQKFEVYITGHSQGAAHAQMAAFLFHGFCSPAPGEENSGCLYESDPDNQDKLNRPAQIGEIGRFKNWPFTVEGVFGFAPPYIIARKARCKAEITTCPDHWAEAIAKYRIDEKSVMVIRDDDPVPSAWRPSSGDIHDIQFRQFGHLYRIGRLGDLRYFGSDVWERFNRPHFSLDYCAGVWLNLEPVGPRNPEGQSELENRTDSESHNAVDRICSNGQNVDGRQTVPTIYRDRKGDIEIRPTPQSNSIN